MPPAEKGLPSGKVGEEVCPTGRMLLTGKPIEKECMAAGKCGRQGKVLLIEKGARAAEGEEAQQAEKMRPTIIVGRIRLSKSTGGF